MEASIKSKVEERLEFRYLMWKRKRVYYFPRAGSQWETRRRRRMGRDSNKGGEVISRNIPRKTKQTQRSGGSSR